MTTEPAVFERLRSQTATLLGFDLANMTPLRSLRLDRATLLRLELDRLQAQQSAGQAVDLSRVATASQQLEALLPPEDGDGARWDVTRLSDDDLHTLDRIVSIAMGLTPPAEPVTESHPDPALARLGAELDQVRQSNQALSIQLESARSQIANAQAETKTAVEARLAAEARLAEVAAPPPRDQPPRIVVNNHQSQHPHDWLPQMEPRA